jgi:hypothetical protein
MEVDGWVYISAVEESERVREREGLYTKKVLTTHTPKGLRHIFSVSVIGEHWVKRRGLLLT